MERTELVSEIVRVLTLEGQAILNCAEKLMLSPEAESEAGTEAKSAADSMVRAIEIFAQVLDQGGKIVVTGIGKSGKIGQKIAATLCSTGSLAVFLHPTEGMHGDLGVVRPQDAVLCLSYNGNSDEMVRLLPFLKEMGLPVVGMGGNKESKLAAGCDVWIDGSVEQEACPHNSAPTTSTTLSLALGDALAVTLMRVRGFDAQAFAKNHPGGALGRRFHLKVEDLMHREPPVVAPNALMDEVVSIATQKQLGAVLVADQSRLMGIITDGDIRRALRLKEKFFDLEAEQVMTRTPVVAFPEMLAYASLRLMEDRPSQIAVLPVVDTDGNWKGLLRLHDLVRTF